MLNFSKQTLTKSEFKQLANRINLKYLNLEQVVLTNDDGSSMSNIEINTLINETLNTCTGLRYVSLAKISALNTIEFVKGKNLIELLLNGTSVTTGTVDASGNYTGLELLNTNGDVKYVNNVSILGDLNIQGKLKKLYIDDNFMDDLTVLEELEWNDYTGW